MREWNDINEQDKLEKINNQQQSKQKPKNDFKQNESIRLIERIFMECIHYRIKHNHNQRHGKQRKGVIQEWEQRIGQGSSGVVFLVFRNQKVRNEQHRKQKEKHGSINDSWNIQVLRFALDMFQQQKQHNIKCETPNH